MVTIEILQQEDTTEDDPTIKERIQIQGIQALRITPMNIKVSIPIPMTELLDLINEIKPIEGPQQEELDSYYAMQVPVYNDGNLSTEELDLPHHIGLRVALESVIRKYNNTSTSLQIRII